MKKILYFITILFLLNTSIVYAAPSMEYIVVNDEQKTCGRHWPGDEFAQYELPKGWRAVGSITDMSQNKCSNMSSPDLGSFYEQCCTKLGYEYLPENNIISKSSDILGNISLGIIILGASIFILIKYFLGKRRSKLSKSNIT